MRETFNNVTFDFKGRLMPMKQPNVDKGQEIIPAYQINSYRKTSIFGRGSNDMSKTKKNTT